MRVNGDQKFIINFSRFQFQIASVATCSNESPAYVIVMPDFHISFRESALTRKTDASRHKYTFLHRRYMHVFWVIENLVDFVPLCHQTLEKRLHNVGTTIYRGRFVKPIARACTIQAESARFVFVNNVGSTRSRYEKYLEVDVYHARNWMLRIRVCKFYKIFLGEI